MEKYIGIEEHNDNEGETFGYYVTETPQNTSSLQRVIAALEDHGFDEDTYELSLEALSERDLSMVAKGSRNSYMSRVNILEEPVKWDEIIDEIEKGNDPLYKGGNLRIAKQIS